LYPARKGGNLGVQSEDGVAECHAPSRDIVLRFTDVQVRSKCMKKYSVDVITLLVVTAAVLGLTQFVMAGDVYLPSVGTDISEAIHSTCRCS
jgi:hypothetical protein